MSQREFQAMMGRMVVDTEFRARVRQHGVAALDADLTPREERRLLSVAADRGMDATRLVHTDFRLSKLYVMLPLTRLVLGRRRFLREANDFWSKYLPVTHYFIPESIDFCDYLQQRLRRGHLRVKYLREIVAYERAELELQRPRPDAAALPPPQIVEFRYDPIALFTSLTRQRRPRAIPPLDCALTGTLDRDGQIRWQLRADEPAAQPATGHEKEKLLRAHRRS